MRGHSLVELTENDDSAANIIVHSINSTQCVPIMNGRRRGTREESRKQALDSADARWDCQTRLARPNFQARMGTGNNDFSLFS